MLDVDANVSDAIGDKQTMAHSQTDAEVIERSLADPETFAIVYERHRAAVYTFLRWRVGTELAEEWLAETFAQAFRSRERYQPRHDTCRAWLIGIAAHLVANFQRSERRGARARERTAAHLSDRRLRGGSLADEVLDSATLDGELVAAVRALSDEDREVLLLHAWGELSPKEIANALGVRAGTVRSRLHRARAQVRRHLAATDARHDCEAAIATTGESHA